MPHTRSQGPPPFVAALEPERVFRERIRLLRANQVHIPLLTYDMGDANPPARRVVADYARPNAFGTRSSITRPAIATTNWSIPPQIISMVANTI